MSTPADDTSVQVALRIRPQSASEKIDMCHICTSVTPGHPQVVLGKDKAFTYDFVFDIDSVQPNIYDEIARPLIEGCFDGYNATILAYGQTGSGKTYTMGTSFDVGVPEDSIGIIPRAARHLFDGIKKRREKAEEDGKPLPEFKVSAQFLELYNEEIIDLLDIENKGRKTIKVHEDHNGNIYMTGILAKTISSADETMQLLEEGAISRSTAATNMNATSSRSHAIFTILLKHHRLVPTDEDGAEEFETLNAKFNFVDLAGSERLKRTGAVGDRAKEGISINQGLLSLGNVISALGDKTKRGTHVPYRDSKLTRLLQDSLGGNSRTLMIACISPSDRDFMETLNSLKYANRARNIKNKVMVNQDKASKQIAILRQEIQQLTLELVEYKQGKRVADTSGEHMTDTFHELEMLRTENENLRMRVKALKQNVDSQSIQLTELKVSAVLAQVTGDDTTAIEDMVKNYENQIQKLSNQLQESQAMSTAAVHRAQAVSRLAMSPGGIHDDADELSSILNAAKEDLRKERKMKKRMSKKKKVTTPTITENTEEEEKADESEKAVIVISDDEEETSDPTTNGVDINVKDKDKTSNNKKTADRGSDLEDEVEDEDEEEEEEELESNTDSDTDDELNQSIKEESELNDHINDLNTDITIKQKLIDELEHSQQRLTALKHQYEQKLNLMHNKIKETENERDKVLKNIGSVDSVAREKADAVRKRYEKKLATMQKELSKLHNAKREHQRLLKTKEQNEQQLKLMRNELNDMKKMKVKLMRQMRDEVARNKKRENKMNQQMESVMKENRKKEVELKRLKDEKRQRDLVLKRKQEELNSMRKQAKPVSGNVSTRNNTRSRPNNLQLKFQATGNNQGLNATFVVDSKDGELPVTPKKKGRIPVSSNLAARSPAVSKKAKHKWELLERKLTELTIRMKNVAQMENDMERWLADRERVGKQLDSARKRKEEAEKHANSQDETLLKELNNQVEGLEAHMEYIQENITESQGTIMDMEEEGEGVNTNELISSSSLAETKYLLEHFYSKAVETAQELANKDAAYKEIQIKLEAMEKHCEVQQQLLQHACNLEYGAGYMPMEEEDQLNNIDDLPDVVSVGGTQKKARRKTALPEELLHPKEPKALKTSPTVIEIEDNDDDKDVDSPVKIEKEETVEHKQKIADTFQLDDKTLQKLVDLEKTLRDRKKMPPPPAPGGNHSTSHSANNTRVRSDSLSDSTDKPADTSLPASFVRNTRVTKSARPFSKSTSASNLKTQRSLRGSSNPGSPKGDRKTLAEASSLSVDLDSANVFKRLTSSLPQECDPDLGQILPSKASSGKPDSLLCMYTATGHSNAVLSLDVLNELMVTGSKDRTAKIWDLNTSEEVLSLSQHKRDVTVVKFCPSRNVVYTVYQSTIKIWDLRQGSVVKTLSSGLFHSVGEASIMDLDLNKDGTVLYSAIGNTVKIIDLKTYSTLGKLTGHTGAVTCLLVADTGHHHDNVITGSKDHYVKIFEVVDEVASSQVPRQNLEPPHYDGVQSLAMKGNHLFSGSRDNTIKKWNFSNHDLEQHFTYAHKDWVTSLDFVPNSDVLISGDRRGVLKLWHVDTCKPLGDITAHGKSINAIKCNSNCVFTASSDRLVRIWKPSQTLDDQLAELTSE